MTPPKVDGAAKPTSSVRISRTFGALAGGMTWGGQADMLSTALGRICPPNGGVGAGNCRPGNVRTALGDPGVPRTSCAWTTGGIKASSDTTIPDRLERRMRPSLSL